MTGGVTGGGTGDVTRDAFLGGRLRLLQPRHGYRAGIEPVFLAAAVDAAAGESVLELGCGAGTAILCLGTRVPGLALTGVERDPAMAALARRNADDNGIAARIVEADALDLPMPVRGEIFDHVIANPPWWRTGTGRAATDTGRDAGRRSGDDVGLWVAAARRRIRPGGRLALILPVAAVPDAIRATGDVGSLVLTPFAPREGRAPTVAILTGRKGGRGAFALRPVVTVHAGDRHEKDGDDHAPAVRAVLRHGRSWAEAILNGS